MKRSVIVEFIEALRFIDSRVIDWRLRPTRFAGMTKIGRMAIDTSVSRHSSNSMATSVPVNMITLETTVPRVPVNARWAPMTSLLSRLISAPVWVRVKNDIGMRCTWSKSLVRRS